MDIWGFPGGSDGKESCKAGDLSLIPGLGRSPGEGNGILQYSCLGNPMDRGACWLHSPWGHRLEHNWVTSPTQWNWTCILKHIYMTAFVKYMPRFKWDFSLSLEKQLDRYRAPPLGCPAPLDIISVCSSIQSPWKYLTWWSYLFYPSNCIISCFLMRLEEQMSNSMYQFLCCGRLSCQARELASQKCILLREVLVGWSENC